MRFFTFLLFFTYANLGLALGLGEIELKSNLGEPLFAQVIVTDVEKLPQTSCFSVSDISDVPAFRKSTIALQQINNNLLLTISTTDAITEPILNLRISALCESQISRDYLLLLDPTTLVATDNTAVSGQVSEKQITTKKSANNHTQIKPRASKLPAKATKQVAVTSEQTNQKSTKELSATAINRKLNEAYTGKQNSSVAIQPKPTTETNAAPKPTESLHSTDKPYLVISGGNTNANDSTAKPSLSLRLETQLDLARVETTATPLSATDTMDEVTVMSNRLAHLEKQIVSLQSRNTQLLADVEKAKNSGLNWLQILFIAFAILVTLAGAEWLRRKIASRHAINDATWFDAGTDIDTFDEFATFDKNGTDSFEISPSAKPFSAESAFVESNLNTLSAKNTSFANMTPLSEHDTDTSESVIDHAHVFIEHGRPALAIQLLQNHLSDLPSESPAVWLELLDLLAKEGIETEYDDAVIESNKFFNIKAASFANATLKSDSSIEDYPDIVTRLEGVWGSQYAVGFLNDLIYHQQSQPKEGFEKGTFDDLFFLKKIASLLQPLNEVNQQTSFYQPEVVKSNLEQVATNQAIFSGIKPSNEMGISRNDGESNSQNRQHNQLVSTHKTISEPLYTSSDTAYEVNMLFDTEETPILEDTVEPVAINQPLEIPTPSVDGSFNEVIKAFEADEINFSKLDDEALLEGTSLELVLDTNFLIEETTTKIDLPDKDKKSPTKPIKSNVIDWDVLDYDKE